MLGKVKPVPEWGDWVRGSSRVELRSDPVCGVGCAPLRQSGGDDRKAFAVERADRRDQSEDETCRGALRPIGEMVPRFQNRQAGSE
jgi:hypothetical protein